MSKTVVLPMLLSVAALLTGALSRAEDKKADAPDEKAAMEAMIKAATPGEPHKKLAAMTGTWEGSMKMWMDPSKPPVESKATSEIKTIMEGRYLEEKVTGEFGGMKFLGQALTAYDNVQKKYTLTWIDNMGTGVYIATGSYDPGKKTYTYHGEEIDPLSGKKIKDKLVIHVIDKDKFESDMYKEMGGKDVHAMHITYTRKAEK